MLGMWLHAPTWAVTEPDGRRPEVAGIDHTTFLTSHMVSISGVTLVARGLLPRSSQVHPLA